MPNVNETAPEFTLPRDGGGSVSLAELAGAPVVLFFYPKDDTSGCTKESIAFSDLYPQFQALGVHVFGISKDSVAKHDKFRAKHGLTVPLLSDEGTTTCEDYGVWKEKSMYGKTYMGIERTTVLICADGKIAHIWPKVKVAGHAEAVLEAVKAL